MPIRYEVTAICASSDIRARYLAWMRDEHVDDLLRVDGCLECRIAILSDLKTRAEYLFLSEEHLNKYLHEIAPKLRLEVRKHFTEQDIKFERSQSEIAYEKTSGDLRR